MGHTELNSIHNVNDAAKYWHLRLEAKRAIDTIAASHWTSQHPPNVVLHRSAQGSKRKSLDADQIKEADQLSEWCRQHGLETPGMEEARQPGTGDEHATQLLQQDTVSVDAQRSQQSA